MPAMTNEPWRGLAHVRVGDGERGYTLSIDDVNPLTADLGNQASWEGTPGGSLTLRLEWASTAVPVSGQATEIRVRVYVPGGAQVGSQWTFSHPGTANGSTTRTLHFDDDPLNQVLNAIRAGTLELFLWAVRTTAVAWDADSRGGGAPPAGAHTWARGYVRAPVKLSSYSISNASLGGAEPASFAFPDTVFQRLGLDAVWYRSAAIQVEALQSGVAKRLDGGTATTAVTRDYTWSTTSTTLGGAGRLNSSYSAAGVDVFVTTPTNTFGGAVADREYAWASSGHAAGFSVASEALLTSVARFTADPAISLGSLTTGQSIYNREEASTHQFKILNARSELIPINALWNLRDGANGIRQSFNVASSGGFFTGNYTIGATDRAALDLVGDQWNILTTFPDMSGLQVSANVFTVSRLWRISTLGNGTINGLLFTDKAHSPTSDGKTIFNRGQPVFFRCFVYNVRGVLLASPTINFNVRPIGSETFEDTNDTEPLASGEFTGAGATYTVDTDEATGQKALVIASQTASGTNQPRTGVAGSGNFAESPTGTGEWQVSSAYTVTRHMQVNDNALDPALNTTERLTSDLGFVSVKVVDAHGDAVDGAVGDIALRDDADLVAQVTFAGLTTAAQNGNNGYAPLQAWDSTLPGGGWDFWTSTAFTKDGNSGSIARSGAGTFDLTLLAVDASIHVVVGGGDPSTPGEHWSKGKPLTIGVGISRVDKQAAPDASSVRIALLRFDYDLGTMRYLDPSDLNSWLVIPQSGGSAWTFEYFDSTTTPAVAASAGNPRLFLLEFSDAQTGQANWNDDGIFLVAEAKVGGTPYYGDGLVRTMGKAFRHTNTVVFDPVALALHGILTKRYDD